jgi:uncharacterized coiled-coil DUF342 family protein
MSKHRTAFSFTYAGSPATKMENAIKTIGLKLNNLESRKLQANTNSKKANINQQIRKYKEQLNNIRKKYRNLLRAKIAGIREQYENLSRQNLEAAIKRSHVTTGRGRGA